MVRLRRPLTQGQARLLAPTGWIITRAQMRLMGWLSECLQQCGSLGGEARWSLNLRLEPQSG